MNKVKVFIYTTIIVVIIGIISYLATLQSNYKNLQRDYLNSVEVIKAYDKENDSLKNTSNLYRLSIEQLKHSNDSIIKKLDNARRELKIKDKNIKQLQYQALALSKRDTIVLRDTVFKDPYLNIDTLLQDKWYKLNLGLKYPSTITVEPEFNNEQYVIISTKKEYVNPPNKCFLIRWFQKKHTIVEVQVVNDNPYTNIKNQKFIEILK